MGKCYCDYCDVFLTNDSVTVRKQHNDGNRHKYNVCEYYRTLIGKKLQEQIDDIVYEFEIKVAKGQIRPTYGLPPGTQKGGEQKPDAESNRKDEKEDTNREDANSVAQNAPVEQANGSHTNGSAGHEKTTASSLADGLEKEVKTVDESSPTEDKLNDNNKRSRVADDEAIETPTKKQKQSPTATTVPPESNSAEANTAAAT